MLSLLMSNACRHFFKNIMLTLLTFVNLEEKTYLYRCEENYSGVPFWCSISRDDGIGITELCLPNQFCQCIHSCWYDDNFGFESHIVDHFDCTYEKLPSPNPCERLHQYAELSGFKKFVVFMIYFVHILFGT